jgi:hypothetical protein
MITATVFVDHSENSTSSDRRNIILDRLRNNEGAENSDILTERIRQAEWQAHHWVKVSVIPEQVGDYLMSEIVGSLAGQSAEERHTRRLSGIIEDALISPILQRSK